MLLIRRHVSVLSKPLMLTMMINSPTAYKTSNIPSNVLKSRKLFMSGGNDIKVTEKHDDLVKVREILKYKGVDVFIIPSDDPHMSEYVAPYYGRREFITGFTGSAGTAVIMQEKALLFVDGRYHNQADIEVNLNDWEVMKQGIKGVPTLLEYLSNSLPSGSTIGIDPSLHSASAVNALNNKLESKSINVKLLESNPIDDVWIQDRPAPPAGKVRIHSIEYAGLSVKEKIESIRKVMNANNAKALTITSLDEIAWLYNIRGCDVPCNPVTVSFSILTDTKAILFIDTAKLPDEIEKHLTKNNVEIRPYNEMYEYTKSLGLSDKVWVDPKTANYLVYNSVGKMNRILKDSPIILMKACKNGDELKGMRSCHIRDGAAMCEFFCWLENEITHRSISEVEVDEKVTSFRAKYGLFIEPSFPTIAGCNSNGAIIHYRAVKETCKMVTNNDMLLLDSGGQYIDGTTDVTRTIHLGTPTSYQIEMFTRVLKGNIGIDSRIFPVGTAGCFLDTYAREHLWAIGKDYIHGTGHGVGAALNVHEGPHRISRVVDAQPLIPGMIVSNEPGYYEKDNFGIRIENLLVVVERKDIPSFGGNGFLGFEKLTHIPIQQKLIDFKMFTQSEKDWLNKYNQDIREKVLAIVKDDKTKQWIIDNTKPV